jgi:phosphopantetheinyl transferase
MIDINACLPTPEMKADFERFKTFSTKEERDAFKKEIQAKYNALPEVQKEAYKKASESGLKATVDACNDFIERAEEAILRDKLGELPEAISFSYIAKKYFGKSRN